MVNGVIQQAAELPSNRGLQGLSIVVHSNLQTRPHSRYRSKLLTDCLQRPQSSRTTVLDSCVATAGVKINLTAPEPIQETLVELDHVTNMRAYPQVTSGARPAGVLNVRHNGAQLLQHMQISFDTCHLP